jgi:hypothetical protein
MVGAPINFNIRNPSPRTQLATFGSRRRASHRSSLPGAGCEVQARRRKPVRPRCGDDVDRFGKRRAILRDFAGIVDFAAATDAQIRSHFCGRV